MAAARPGRGRVASEAVAEVVRPIVGVDAILPIEAVVRRARPEEGGGDQTVYHRLPLRVGTAEHDAQRAVDVRRRMQQPGGRPHTGTDAADMAEAAHLVPALPARDGQPPLVILCGRVVLAHPQPPGTATPGRSPHPAPTTIAAKILTGGSATGGSRR